MSEITEKQLTEVLIGIAKTQAVIFNAMRDTNDLKILGTVHAKVAALAGIGRPVKTDISFENLPAHLFIYALATPRPNAQSIEDFAHEEFLKLLGKS